MSNDTAERYMEERVEDQQRWYSKKATWNKRRYLAVRWAVIALAASIPVVLTVFEEGSLIASIMSALIVIGEGTTSLLKFHENWISYRTTAEMLKKESELFQELAGAYADADNPRQLLVERVESIISKEHTYWVSTTKKAGKSEGVI